MGRRHCKLYGAVNPDRIWKHATKATEMCCLLIIDTIIITYALLLSFEK